MNTNMTNEEIEEIVKKIKSECVNLCEKNIYRFNDEQPGQMIEIHQQLLDTYVQQYPDECMRLVSENGGGEYITCELDFGNGETHIIKSKLPGYAYPLEDSIHREIIDIIIQPVKEEATDG